MIKVISSFIVALPEIIKLIKNIQKHIEQQKVEKKVNDDLKKINKAFESGDAKLLNDVFNGVPVDGKERPEA